MKKSKKLEVLDLSYNEINIIPDYIFDFNFMKNLDLSNNKITTLPPRFKELGNIIVDISNNQIATNIDPNICPIMWGGVTYIYDYNLDNNPIPFPLPKCLQKDITCPPGTTFSVNECIFF